MLGWTWDEVSEQMDFVRLPHVIAEFNRTPPLHVMVAAYLGVKGEQSSEPSAPGSGSGVSADTLLDEFSAAPQ